MTSINIKKGKKYEVKDKFGKFYKAQILEVKKKKFKVHFEKFSDRWDDWILHSDIDERVRLIGGPAKAPVTPKKSAPTTTAVTPVKRKFSVANAANTVTHHEVKVDCPRCHNNNWDRGARNRVNSGQCDSCTKPRAERCLECDYDLCKACLSGKSPFKRQKLGLSFDDSDNEPLSFPINTNNQANQPAVPIGMSQIKKKRATDPNMVGAVGSNGAYAEVAKNKRVKDLKKAIRGALGMHGHTPRVKLVYEGRALLDDSTLNQAGIRHHTVNAFEFASHITFKDARGKWSPISLVYSPF